MNRFAQSIVKLLTTKFPIYKKGLSDDTRIGECLGLNWDGSCNYNIYQLAGYTELDGVDFDFEKTSRITLTEQKQLEKLARRIRQLLGQDKILALTTYHVGADPVECASASYFEDCSYTEQSRSSHHGEVRDILTSASDVFNFFNVMVYDAGENFDYATAMSNYCSLIGDCSKAALGLTINSQWGPNGRFVQSDAENTFRSGWQKDNGYGGIFVWALGSNTENLNFDAQIALINQFIDNAK